ncbi:hypothetical protein BUALT_Bualt09G0035300 [Buddleja alternifolia]|uniref:Uncharacterized protein n=1 Tax=Buddleja alternifolia TaxID=168488 RepID=A0AAV6WZQ8_9LAMI|nr:hypothetical protein BUALT_Bualt09G0035300 [Buddleja alternifolia]
MDDFRSKSYNDERMNNNNTDNNYSSTHVSDNGPNYKSSSNPSGMQDLRCYSASYASSSSYASYDNNNNNNNGVMDIVVAGGGGEQWKFKKGKSMNGMGSLKSWSFNDPELQRKKRVATYKAYTVEAMAELLCPLNILFAVAGLASGVRERVGSESFPKVRVSRPPETALRLSDPLDLPKKVEFDI